jgi:hypothetical protein
MGEYNTVQWRMNGAKRKRTKGRRGVGEKGVISPQRIEDRVLPLFTCMHMDDGMGLHCQHVKINPTHEIWGPKSGTKCLANFSCRVAAFVADCRLPTDITCGLREATLSNINKVNRASTSGSTPKQASEYENTIAESRLPSWQTKEMAHPGVGVPQAPSTRQTSTSISMLQVYPPTMPPDPRLP